MPSIAPLDYLLVFLAGALLCNAIPHLAAGLRGERFPTPFAKPRGVGLSSPVLNMLWGLANLGAGAALAGRAFGLGFDPRMVALLAGMAAIGLYLASHFGKGRTARGVQ